jgi:hypothetical protein
MEKRILDEATRAKLAGLVPFSDDAKVEFTPAVFENRGIDADLRPVFTLRGFRKTEKANTRKLLKDLEKADETAFKEAARKCILAWRNLFDAGTGEEIAFEIDADGDLKREIYDRLPVTVVGQILFEIARISGLLDMDKLGLK